MNYQRIYNEIVNNAKLRGLNKKLLDYYTEKHHIIPKCLNGTNDKSNLVLLTAREHYLCHWLLWKANKENKSLLCAYNFLVRGQKHKYTRCSSKQYEKLRIEFSKFNSKLMSGRTFTNESIEKMKASAKERIKIYPIIITDETRLKISNAHIGKCRTQQTKEKISLALKGKPKSKDHIEKCTRNLQSDESKRKRSESLKGRIPWNKGKCTNKHKKAIDNA